MIVNHKRIRQILHGIAIIAFTVSVLFKLKDLYIYGGKPPKQIDDDNDNDNDNDNQPPLVEEHKDRTYGRKDNE